MTLNTINWYHLATLEFHYKFKKQIYNGNKKDNRKRNSPWSSKWYHKKQNQQGKVNHILNRGHFWVYLIPSSLL